MAALGAKGGQVMRETAVRGSEASIVWTLDPEQFEYVRVSLTDSDSRTAPIRWGRADSLPVPYGEVLVVGYATLKESARKDSVFFRRVFWIKDYDRNSGSKGAAYQHGAPAEAVDPRTIEPNVKGVLTPLAWHGDGKQCHAGCKD